jgi:hypothetical protein
MSPFDELLSLVVSDKTENGCIRAFMYETQSLIAFLVHFLKVSDRSGKGGSQCKEVPRSPCVPIAHR